MEEIVVSRQAIYNAHHEVVGYELLFHDNETANHASGKSGAEQSARLIVNTFMQIGLENLVGSNKAFLNLSHDFFSNAHPIPMASYQVVLEVTGNCIEDERVYKELMQLNRQGYTFSLYDYEYNEATAGRLDCIDIIKLDISHYDAQFLKEQSRYYRNHGKRIHITGLQNDSQQLLCSQLGIDFYQGEFLGATDTVRSQAVRCNRQILEAIADHSEHGPVVHDTLIDIVGQDPILCYRLLRYINCASFAGRSEIHSLRQAIGLFGITTLKEWAQLMLTAQSNTPDSREPSTLGLIRANMCKELVGEDNADLSEKAFLCGLLSSLEETMQTPLETLFDSISLSPDITFALLYGEGPLGHLLRQVEHYEKKEWHELDTSKITRDAYSSCYQRALNNVLRACG